MDPYKYINSFDLYGDEGGYKPGLDRMKLIMEELGHPEENLRIIHVAGSNGKGSTIAFLHSIYRQAGYRVGRYISPPLFHFNERICINDKPISEAELKVIVEEIKSSINKISRNYSLGRPSFFEVVTAVALVYFARNEVDLVLLEVGLGGRLDATNIIKSPLVSVITGISLEHTSILGSTIAEIAREKAGIIKEECPVVTGVRDGDALTVIKHTADGRRAPLFTIDDKYTAKLLSASLSEQRVKVEEECEEWYLNIPLLGEHQIRNTLIAMAVVETLRYLLPVSKRNIIKGIDSTRWPGRLEVVQKKPVIIMDVAHNTESMKILTDFLSSMFDAGTKIHMVLAILRDKDIRGILSHLHKMDFELEIAVTANKSSRALEPEIIGNEAANLGINYKIFPAMKRAITEVLEQAGPDELIVITGSIYTVREAKIIFADDII